MKSEKYPCYETIELYECLREIKQLSKEGIIGSVKEASDEVQLAESPDEAYVVMAKVRCFSCKKWGHFSRKCPLE